MHNLTEEILEKLDLPSVDVSYMLNINERITSVDTPLGGDDKALFDVLTDDDSVGLDYKIQNEDMSKLVVKWLNDLNTKQR